MKINQVTFGQTFLKPSIDYLSQYNQEKLRSLGEVGAKYPNDIYIGATPKGDLTLDITRGSLYDYMILNDLLEPTKENIEAYNIIKRAEIAAEELHGPLYPVNKSVISCMDYIPEDLLKYQVTAAVEEYNKQYAHLFTS